MGRLAVGSVMSKRLELLREAVYLVGERGAVALGSWNPRTRAKSRAVDVAARCRVGRYGRTRRRRRQHGHLLDKKQFDFFFFFIIIAETN